MIRPWHIFKALEEGRRVLYFLNGARRTVYVRHEVDGIHFDAGLRNTQDFFCEIKPRDILNHPVHFEIEQAEHAGSKEKQ